MATAGGPSDHHKYAIYPSLLGKIALVTGGAEGIGGSIVEIFALQGAQVIIADIAEDSALKLIEKIKGTARGPIGPEPVVPVFYECDVTNLDTLKSTVDRALAQFSRIDILVNNAASSAGKARVATKDVTPEAWEFNINVNLRHQFFLSQLIFPHMAAQKSGAIVNMGSINWKVPGVGLPIYTTCKAAVVGLTRTHAREFGPHGIRVNSVMPGSIATERQIKEVLTDEYKAETIAAQAIKRVIDPHEAARVVVFLCTDDASAVTGSQYVVDGGWIGDP
ncbi:NAD(P)-binding protein [Dissoconium aciculare CBS 342.82]|jgi:NAD(P)-dependent dehydrogenase (short-subunit alcohol dehydrogenase family)|uniref:NAD(P)-binding protein n=1 Tax=Dissoconium aciculare CBS 342.82 TaxID=1314786 RepID=A0A6J3LWN5_9PEZI|nr:NAD(P)-binding protein [Dissoconium aciculare CBS 342.82]KAF1819052.1 NAD(P)-binding protein [Dissoconium aciculare CBS 342.82]